MRVQSPSTKIFQTSMTWRTESPQTYWELGNWWHRLMPPFTPYRGNVVTAAVSDIWLIIATLSGWSLCLSAGGVEQTCVWEHRHRISAATSSAADVSTLHYVPDLWSPVQQYNVTYFNQGLHLGTEQEHLMLLTYFSYICVSLRQSSILYHLSRSLPVLRQPLKLQDKFSSLSYKFDCLFKVRLRCSSLLFVLLNWQRRP